MSLEEFTELAKYIYANHGFRDFSGGKTFIKYVRCSFDTRTNQVYSISLDKVDFTTVNENRKRDLKKWVYCYLRGMDDGFDLVRDDPEIDWKNLLKDKK